MTSYGLPFSNQISSEVIVSVGRVSTYLNTTAINDVAINCCLKMPLSTINTLGFYHHTGVHLHSGCIHLHMCKKSFPQCCYRIDHIHHCSDHTHLYLKLQKKCRKKNVKCLWALGTRISIHVMKNCNDFPMVSLFQTRSALN